MTEKLGNIRSVDWTGRRLGFLTGVRGVRRPGRVGNAHSKVWLWRCDCGRERKFNNHQAHKYELRLKEAPNKRHLLAKLTCLHPDCSVREKFLGIEGLRASALRVKLPGDKRRAKQMGEFWGLSEDQWWAARTKPCQCCGHELKVSGMKRISGLHDLGLWQSGMGWTETNVVAICAPCKRMVWHLAGDIRSFVEHATRVVQHNIGAWDFCKIDVPGQVTQDMDILE